MKALIKGHSYILKNHESKETQALVFIQKQPIPNSPKGEMEVVQEGTTNVEVLKMLIDRYKHLNSLLTSRENSHVITLLEKALQWEEKRTADRIKRKVKGTHKA